MSLATAVTDCLYTIEPANWRDLNQVRTLEQVCFPKDIWPLWDLIGVLTMPGVVRLKAICDGKLIGFIAGDTRRADHISWIATLGVLPEFRSQGLGSSLLQACEEQLPTSVIRLCVRTTNDPAIHLYLNAGYHKVGLWPSYYQDGEDALVMEKTR